MVIDPDSAQTTGDTYTYVLEICPAPYHNVEQRLTIERGNVPRRFFIHSAVQESREPDVKSVKLCSIGPENVCISLILLVFQSLNACNK